MNIKMRYSLGICDSKYLTKMISIRYKIKYEMDGTNGFYQIVSFFSGVKMSETIFS